MSMAVVGLLLALVSADAQEADAKKLFSAAATAYKRGDYPTAISALRAAYNLAPKEQVVFSLAQAYRLQFSADRDPLKLSRAVDLYREYLRRFDRGKRRRHAAQHERSLSVQLEELRARRPEAFKVTAEKPQASFIVTSAIENAKVTIGDEEITEFPDTFDVEPGPYHLKLEAPGYAKKEIDTRVPAGATVPLDVVLDPLPARLGVSAPDGAQILVDGARVGEAPLPRRIELDAGRHLVAVVKNGHYAYSEDVSIGRGEEVGVVADLESTDQRTVSYVFMGVGATLLGFSALAAVSALGQQAEAKLLEDRLMASGLTTEEVDEHGRLKDRRDDAVLTASGLAVGAAIAGIVGVFLYALDTPRAPTSSLVTDFAVTPTTDGGGMATVGGQF